VIAIAITYLLGVSPRYSACDESGVMPPDARHHFICTRRLLPLVTESGFAPFTHLSPSGDRADMTTALSAVLYAALAGRYVLERKLGRGGMSRVFLAREIALGRIVVLKVWEKVTGPR
jgi:serine/threonine protein kinase